MEELEDSINKALNELSKKQKLIEACRSNHDSLVNEHNNLIYKIQNMREDQAANEIYRDGCNHRDNHYGKFGQVEGFGNRMKTCTLCNKDVMGSSGDDNRWYTPAEWKRARVIRDSDRLITEETIEGMREY